MSEKGYIRIGRTVYLNIFNEEESNRLEEILTEKHLEYEMEKEEYDKDWVTDEIIYSFAFAFDCDEATLISILSELNGTDDNLSSDDIGES